MTQSAEISYTEISGCAKVILPAGKSLAARAILLGVKTDADVAKCDDIKVLRKAINRKRGLVNVNDSGTAMRFLTAYFAATPGVNVILTGSVRLQSRPIGALVDSLRKLEANINYIGKEGYPPIHIRGHFLPGGEVTLDATESSQYLSALLLAAPKMEHTLAVNVSNLTSSPYAFMTLEVCRQAGIKAFASNNVWTVHPGSISSDNINIEPDWSAASYFFEISAITRRPIFLKNLTDPAKSLQGDRRAAPVFAKLGVGIRVSADGIYLRPIDWQCDRLDINMADSPDLVPALAVCAALKNIPFHITGIASLRIKESDRISTIANGLLQLGYNVSQQPDALIWNGEKICPAENPCIDAAGDHRIAMSFTPAAILFPNIKIKGVETVSKSFPTFFKETAKLGLILKNYNSIKQ